MVAIEPNDRPDFIEIQKLLDNFWMNQSSYEENSN